MNENPQKRNSLPMKPSWGSGFSAVSLGDLGLQRRGSTHKNLNKAYVYTFIELHRYYLMIHRSSKLFHTKFKKLPKNILFTFCFLFVLSIPLLYFHYVLFFFLSLPWSLFFIPIFYLPPFNLLSWKAPQEGFLKGIRLLP